MKAKINKKIVSLADGLVKQSKKIAPQFDKDSVHELRTGFKKLRALLRWQKAGTKKLKPLKDIYSAAGDIRNIQMTLEKMSKEKRANAAFKAWLAIQEKQSRQKWISVLEYKIVNKVKEDVEKKEVKSKRHKKFFFKKIKKIKQLLKLPFIPDDTVHAIRKMMKDMQYANEALQKEIKQKRIFKSKANIKSINEKLGNYIDMRVMLQLFGKYRMQQRDPSQMPVNEGISKQWEKEKVIEKQELLKMLNKKIATAGLR